MRTSSLLTVSQHALGRGMSAQGGVCPGGCLPRGVSAQGCVCSGGVGPGRVSAGGGDLPRGDVPKVDTHLWTEWQTHVKTLPFRKLRLWVVTRMHSSRMHTSHLLPYMGVGSLCPAGLCQGDPLSPTNRMTHRCKNIILPQTSFAGGNEKAFL